MSRQRRPFPSDKPFVYLLGRAQPGAPWTGSFADGYKGTALTPPEKVTYVDDVSSGRHKVPVLIEHDAHDEIGQALPSQAVIGQSIGAFHDGPGNVFQIVQLPTSNVATYRVWDDLEYGKKLGFSLRTDLQRLGTAPTAPVVALAPTHIAITPTPDWSTADKPDPDPTKHQPPNFDTGTWIYHWTDEPAELRGFMQERYMEPTRENFFTRVPPSLLRRIDELAADRPGAPRQSEPPVEIRSTRVVPDATVASAGRVAVSTEEKKIHSPSASQPVHKAMASTEQKTEQPAASPPAAAAATPPAAPAAATPVPATETKPAVTIVPDRMMAEIKLRLDDYNSEKSAGRKLDKNEELAAYVHECIKQVKDMRMLSDLFPVVKQLADDREASVSAVPEWINLLRQSGVIVPDTAAFALQAEKNAHTEDGRLWRDLVVAAAGKAKSQREIEMQQLRSLDSERTEKESLKRKLDDAQLELTAEKAKRVKAEENLAGISPETYAAAHNPAAAAASTTKPAQPVVADAVTASARNNGGAMSFGGQAGDATKASRLWAELAARPGRGGMTAPPKLEKAQSEALSKYDVESIGVLSKLPTR